MVVRMQWSFRYTAFDRLERLYAHAIAACCVMDSVQSTMVSRAGQISFEMLLHAGPSAYL